MSYKFFGAESRFSVGKHCFKNCFLKLLKNLSVKSFPVLTKFDSNKVNRK